jgi:hypothetical protein
VKPVAAIKNGVLWTVYQDNTGRLMIYPRLTSYETNPPVAFMSIQDARDRGWVVIEGK